MPTYEYECQKCRHRFEAFQSMKDEPLTECPKCGGPVKRLISGGAGLIFKGSGFYLTDYRSDSYKKRAREEGGGKTDAKSDAKSDKKGDKKSGESKSDASKPSKSDSGGTA